MHSSAWALAFAEANTGNNIPARMAMMAITTRSSISVKAWRVVDCDLIRPKLISPENEFLGLHKRLIAGAGNMLVVGDGIGHNILAVDDDG